MACSSSPATITVTLNANYEGGATQTETTTSDKTYTPSWTPTRDGYYFMGWYYDSTCTNKYTSTTLTKNTTLYAAWEQTAGIVTIKCVMDFTGVTLAKGDKIVLEASYSIGSQFGSERFTGTVKDPDITSKEIELPIRAGSGTIKVTVTRDGAEIGSGSKDVEKYAEGATYTVTVVPAN